jgi:hypothetical protein
MQPARYFAVHSRRLPPLLRSAVLLVRPLASTKVIGSKLMIDEIARDLAITRYGLAESLHVPIGAVDETAISTYVGEVQKVLSGGSARKALLVQAKPPPALDPRFPIWRIDGCQVLHQRLQVWADVAYTRYAEPITWPFQMKHLAT